MPSSAVYVGIGTNLGRRVAQLRAALARLTSISRERLRLSAIYEARGLGPPQPDYLNAVARLTTELEPLPLLGELQRIEHDLGRVRVEHWGPRTIDLDLLLWCRDGVWLTIAAPGLTLPHPGIADRDFVLAPLCDLDATLEVAPGVSAAARLSALVASQRTIVRRFALRPPS